MRVHHAGRMSPEKTSAMLQLRNGLFPPGFANSSVGVCQQVAVRPVSPMAVR